MCAITSLKKVLAASARIVCMVDLYWFTMYLQAYSLTIRLLTFIINFVYAKTEHSVH